MFALLKPIHTRIHELLLDSSLSYVKTLQKGFVPRDTNNLVPTLYPWIFTEYGGTTPVEVYRTPLVFTYEFTMNIIAMTFADKGEVQDLVFSAGLNTNVGIGDIIEDLGILFDLHKVGGFGVNGVIDWKYGRTGTPNVLNVQPFLMMGSPYVRGVQMDLVFQCQERMNL